MEPENWITLISIASTTALAVLSAEGLTFASRARRKAKAAAEVASALPEGSEARAVALALAELEVERWRARVAPTRDESQAKWVRFNRIASLGGAILASVISMSVGVLTLLRDERTTSAAPAGDELTLVAVVTVLVTLSGVVVGVSTALRGMVEVRVKGRVRRRRDRL